MLLLCAVHLTVPFNYRLLHTKDDKIRYLNYDPHPPTSLHGVIHHLVNEVGNASLHKEVFKVRNGHSCTSSHLSAHFQVGQVVP